MYFGLKRLALMGVVFALLTTPSVSLAAGLDLITFVTTPKSPGALEKIVVRIESFAVDLNTANIAWNVNKEFVKDGIAEKELTITTPDFGQKTVVDVVIITAAGDKIDKQFVIAPAEVDLLFEAQTYTPPFYKGKALPTFKSLVRVTAIPRFNALTSNPKDYYYAWTYNRNQGLGEAQGKNSVVVPMGYADSQIPVGVKVNLAGTDWTGVKNITISGVPAKVVLYERDPLLGVQFHKPLTSTLSSKETELTLYAVPYFFSSDDLENGNLIYTWEVNRRYTSPGLSPRYLTLVKPEKSAATYGVSLRIQNPKRILQEAYANTEISFTAE
jgi:hypothetical protein